MANYQLDPYEDRGPAPSRFLCHWCLWWEYPFKSKPQAGLDLMDLAEVGVLEFVVKIPHCFLCAFCLQELWNILYEIL